MARLYEIMQEIEGFEFEVDGETGEILNADALDLLEIERDTKIENICLWIKNLRADARAYRDEKAAFDEKRKRAENKAKSLERYVQGALNGAKFNTGRVSVSYRKSEAVECGNAAGVDGAYLRQRPPELDKAKIRDAIKQGVKVEGCRLVERQNIQIK